MFNSMDKDFIYVKEFNSLNLIDVKKSSCAKTANFQTFSIMPLFDATTRETFHKHC